MWSIDELSSIYTHNIESKECLTRLGQIVKFLENQLKNFHSKNPLVLKQQLIILISRVVRKI